MTRQFLPFLTDDQGKSLAIENGVVVTKAIPDPLNNSPEGWEKNTIQAARNTEFKGIIKTYTTTLKFFLDAAKILRTFFYTKGVETVLYFIWLKQNVNFGGGMKYEGWYKGEPDFSTFKDKFDAVEINIIEGGFYKDLQANKSVPYEIPFDNDSVSIEMDGLEIFNKLNYAVADGFQYNTNTWAAIAPFISSEGTNFTITTNSQNYEDVPGSFTTYVTTSTNWMLKNASNQNQVVRITGKLFFKAAQNGTLPLSLFRLLFATSIQYTLSGNIDNPYQVIFETPIAGQTYSVDVDFTFNLLPTEAIFLMGIMVSTNFGVFNAEFLPDSFLVADFASRKEETVIKAMRAFDLGNKLCLNMSKNISTMKSDLLSNDYNLLITSGDAIRSIKNAVIKTKFSDYHKSIDAVKCISFGVENNNGRLEKREHAFSNSETVNLGVIKMAENFLEVANEYRYSSIEVGYPVKNIENLNGRYSFNNTIVYKTPILRGGANVYDAKSVYYADPYVTEILRINLENKVTTDDKSDNDVFFLDGENVYDDYVGEVSFVITNNISIIIIDGIGFNFKVGVRFKVLSGQNISTFTITYVSELGGQTYIQVAESIIEEVVNITIEFLHYKLRRLPYVTIAGVPAIDSIFNIELSPDRNLMNHYRWIASSMDKLEEGKLIYQTTEKNSELVTIDANNVVIKEKEDIPIAILGSKIYKPYFFNIEAKTPVNLLELIVLNSGGYFTFSVNDVDYTGFIDEVKSNEATLETQEYRLLATANNDLTKLINGR